VDVQTRVISIFQYHDGQQIERWLYLEDIDARNAISTG